MTNVKYSDLGMSVKMHLYTLSKRQILIIFFTFLAAFFLTINIGIFGPDMLTSITTSAANKTRVNLKTGPFTLVTPYLNKFHQKLWITAKPIISGRKEEFSKNIFLNLHLRQSIKDQTSSLEESVNRTRTLHCNNENCDVFSILHLDYLHNDRYSVVLKLYGLTDIGALSVKDFEFTFNSYNPSFTQLELCYRFFFLFLTLIVTVSYTRSLKKFSIRDWSIEQKWIFILLRSMLFFNNPLFPLCVIVDSWIPHLLDAIFQSTFFAMILVFWLSLYHGVRQNDRNFLTFYVPKFVLVFIIWLLSLAMLLWQQFHSFGDPTYTLTMDESNYLIFRVIFFVFSVLYLLFLLFLMVRAMAELRNTPYFDVRIKFSIALMLVVISTLVTIGISRYQSEPFRQSLFENFTKNYHSSVEFCAIFAVLNFYINTLAFIYSPAKNASIENDFGDNPTFAMLNSHSDENEEEEDVIFG